MQAGLCKPGSTRLWSPRADHLRADELRFHCTIDEEPRSSARERLCRAHEKAPPIHMAVSRIATVDVPTRMRSALRCPRRSAAANARESGITNLLGSSRSAWRFSPAFVVRSRPGRDRRTHSPATPVVSATGESHADVSLASPSSPTQPVPASLYWRANCSSGILKETPRADEGNSPWAMRSAMTSIARRSVLLIASSRVSP